MSLKLLYQRMYRTEDGTPVPVVIIDILQGVLVLLNLGVGLYAIIHRHHYFSGVSNVLVAFFLVGIHFWAMERRRSRQDAARRLREARIELGRALEQQQEHYSAFVFDEAALEAAYINLQTVAKALGATFNGCGSYGYSGHVEFRKNGWVFRISGGYIQRGTSIGNSADGATTCYMSHTMPPSEKIATALILLNNNPQVFERWFLQDGPYLQ